MTRRHEKTYRSRQQVAMVIGLCALLGCAFAPTRAAFAAAGARGAPRLTPDRFVSCPRLNTGSAMPYVAYRVDRAAIGSRRLRESRRICWLGYRGSRIRALRHAPGQTASWAGRDRLLHRKGDSLHP
jgi:hypothetical protein